MQNVKIIAILCIVVSVVITMIVFDPPDPRKTSVFSEFDLSRLILPQTP